MPRPILRSTLLALLPWIPGALAAAEEPDCPGLTEQLQRIDGGLAERPGDAILHYYRALVLARCGEAAEATRSLHRVEELGDGFLPPASMGFAAIWDDSGFQEILGRLENRLPEVTEAQVAFTASGTDLIPEGIAYDTATGRLFLGSMKRQEILVLSAEGEQRTFVAAEEGLGQILGMAVDGPRHRLLAVDMGKPGTETDTGSVVYEIALGSGEILRRLPAPGAQQLNDVTAAGDGTIYATDSTAGRLRCSTPEDDEMLECFPEVVLRGANGLAISGDTLYVAHSTGIARIDLTTGENLPRIDNDTRETLGGIDGLYARDGVLYGVQNVPNPGRVIAIRLVEGRRAASVETLLSHHHATLAVPTTGALAEDRLLVLANSYVDRLLPDGTLDQPELLRDPVILSVPIE